MWPFSLFTKSAPRVPEKPREYKCTSCGYTTNLLFHFSYHSCEEEMNEFTFTTREEYLEYRAEWKLRYLEAIQEIRKSALARRDANRALFAGTGPIDDLWRTMQARKILKEKATNLLAERARSKEEAARQRSLRLGVSVIK